MNTKGQINQVFVYILSIIIVLFVGFLVVKFIVAFTSDSEGVVEEKLVGTLKNDYLGVKKRYGSEAILDYRVSSKISNVCFSGTPDCDLISYDLPIEDAELEILSSEDNFFLFDKDGIIRSDDIGEFSGCFCGDLKNSRFELLIENKKNVVYISDYSE